MTRRRLPVPTIGLSAHLERDHALHPPESTDPAIIAALARLHSALHRDRDARHF